MILSAISVRISIVFDIRKTQKPDQPIGPPQPIEEEVSKNVAISKNPVVDERKEIEQKEQPQSEEVQKQQDEEAYNYLSQSVAPTVWQKTEKEQNEVQFGFDFEGLFADIKDSDKEKRAKDQFVVKMKWTVKPLVSESQQIKERDILKPSLIYEKNCIYLEDDLVVDPVSRMLYSFQISLTQLPRLLEDEIESFLATLRRSNCKNHVFEFLRELVLKRKQIMIFSLIYKHVFEIFSRALHERNHKSEQNIAQDAPSERLSNGYTILYPNDFQVSFFQPLSEDHNRVCRVYLVELLVEYIRQFNDNLRDHRVQVPSQIQNLLIKQLVKDNRMSYVHFLLQYQILGDSVDFAKLLIEISCKETLEQKKLLGKYQVYEPAFQMGIDMLHRLQRYDEMLDIFIKRGRFSEAAHLMRKYPITQKIKLQPVIDGCNRTNPEYTNQEVVAFFEDIQRKTKGEKLAFTIEELKTILNP